MPTSPATRIAITSSLAPPAQLPIARAPATTSTRNAGVAGIMYRSKKSAESPFAGTTEKKRIGAAIVIAQKASDAAVACARSSATTPTIASAVK